MIPAVLDPNLRLSSYDYVLPYGLIAQEPVDPRDSARMLVLDRASRATQHRIVRDLPELLAPGDLLIVNRSRVLPARLVGRKVPSGGHVEMTLLRPLTADTWDALVRGHRLQAGQRIELENGALAEVGEATVGGRALKFPGVNVLALLQQVGRTPLPPYIREFRGPAERYQTVYADAPGSAAAPTAGFHFTPDLMGRLNERGIGWASIVLHIGLDTFKPITDEDVRERHIHTEWVEVSEEVVAAVERTRANGGRVVAVGTSSVRALEFAARDGVLRPYEGPVNLFVVPGHAFQIVTGLMTNFHMPKTSVLLLVAAFLGRERVLHAYEEAKRENYRFLSFGDSMLIL